MKHLRDSLMNFSKAETVDVRVFEFLAETFSSPQSELKASIELFKSTKEDPEALDPMLFFLYELYEIPYFDSRVLIFNNYLQFDSNVKGWEEVIL